jgi:hypothetical protein
MEHLNRLVKDAVRNLSANKNEVAISRVGRAIETIAPVLRILMHLQVHIRLQALQGIEVRL